MNEHSKMYDKILKWYIDGMWSAKKVRDAVKMGKITQEECDEIFAAKESGGNG